MPIALEKTKFVLNLLTMGVQGDGKGHFVNAHIKQMFFIYIFDITETLLFCVSHFMEFINIIIIQ